MRRPKIDREKLHELARKGASQGQMASAFGVSQAAISKALKELERETTRCLTAPPTSARKNAARVIENSINAAEQLLKINKNANELLDLVMAWQRGDDVALQILESQVCMRKIRIGKEIEQVKEYRFKDPRELALKAMEAIKGHAASSAAGDLQDPLRHGSLQGIHRSFSPGDGKERSQGA